MHSKLFVFTGSLHHVGYDCYLTPCSAFLLSYSSHKKGKHNCSILGNDVLPYFFSFVKTTMMVAVNIMVIVECASGNQHI